MPITYNLRASNNATFHWTRDLTPFASAYDLAGALIRMQARTSPYAPDPPAYQWLSTASAGGEIVFNPATNLCVFIAPEADMARMQGDFVYDCRLEFSGGASIVIFGGRLGFSSGVTRLSADLSGAGVSGVGDTVSVEGERACSPVPLPLSLSAAVAACQAAQAGAAASAANMAMAIAALDLGSASQQPTSAFDPAGAAAAAQGNAEAFATAAIAASTMPAAILSLLTGGGASSPLALALAALIAELPNAPISGVTTLWSNGGALTVSEG
jgi:hypothetical protein